MTVFFKNSKRGLTRKRRKNAKGLSPKDLRFQETCLKNAKGLLQKNPGFRKNEKSLTSKELDLEKTNLKLKKAKTRPNHAIKLDKGGSTRLVAKTKAIRVLLDSGSSGDLLFLEKGASKDIPVIMRAVPQSWGTSNGTFVTDKVGDIEISFWEYSTNKKVHLQPDIVEY